MLQPYLVINVIGWLGSVWEKIELHLNSTCLLELLAAEYLREINIYIFIYHSLMVTCSLDALKKSSKNEEMRIKKEKFEVLRQTIYSRKETRKYKIGMMKILASTLYLLARITFNRSQFSGI